MRMTRLKRRGPTRSSAVQRPFRSERGRAARIVFGPAVHRLRAEACARFPRMSASRAVAARLIRARATGARGTPRRPAGDLAAVAGSGRRPGGGGGGGGRGGGGGPGGGGPGG